MTSSVSFASSASPDPLAVLNSIGEAVYDWDLLTDRLGWSPNAAAVLRVEETRALETGRAYHECTAAVSPSSRHAAIVGSGRADTGSGVPYQIHYALETFVAGRTDLVWVDDTGRWFAGPDGRPAQAHGLVRVTTRRPVAVNSGASGDFDTLTGCVSRARFLAVLDAALSKPDGRAKRFGLLLIGLHDLAALNRRHGYDAVDEALVGVARALRTQIRSADCLARVAGNTFALLLAGCDAEQIEAAAERTLEILRGARYPTQAGPVEMAAVIGGALAFRHGRTVHALMLNAETALAEAGREGERFRLYDPLNAVGDDALRVGDTAAAIVAALNDGRVGIALQPIVLARCGEVTMAEALLRVRLPDGQVLEPAALLPAAEQRGLTGLLDARVFDLAVAYVRDTGRSVSLNISAATMRDPTWPDRVAAAVRLNRGVGERLVFEIAESVLAVDLDESLRALSAVRACGVRIAIDHFGAGHASLRVLRALAPDFLKIDGAFVQNLARSPDDRFVVRSLLAMAREIGAPAIAEWVENASTAATLSEWGAVCLQGSYFGAAEMPAPTLSAVAAVA